MSVNVASINVSSCKHITMESFPNTKTQQQCGVILVKRVYTSYLIPLPDCQPLSLW